MQLAARVARAHEPFEINVEARLRNHLVQNFSGHLKHAGRRCVSCVLVSRVERHLSGKSPDLKTANLVKFDSQMEIFRFPKELRSVGPA